MVEIALFRGGKKESVLETEPGERLFDVLLDAHVPPVSVVVTADGEVVGDGHRIDPERTYEAQLTEGYDINTVRNLYQPPEIDSVHTYRRLSFGKNGEMDIKHDSLDSNEVKSHVEQLLRETIEHYGLIDKDDTILLALSGGVDSTALLRGFEAIREDLPPFDIIAVTVEEPWPDADDEYLKNAASLAEDVGVKHHIIGSETIGDVFNLREPVSDTIEKLEETPYSEQTVALVDHFLTRLLERYAENETIDKIALGVHATELIAGLLNAKITGYDVADIPIQRSKGFSFIYPLSLVTKRELVLYHYAKTGELRTTEISDAWQLAPSDQSFFVFLAEILQYYWPGLQYWLVESPKRKKTADSFYNCGNCMKLLPEDGVKRRSGKQCAACSLLSELDLINH